MPATFDSVHRLLDPSPSDDSLQPGQIFALFRLLAHERSSSEQLDVSNVFIPATPLASRSSNTLTSSVSFDSLAASETRRKSMPASGRSSRGDLESKISMSSSAQNTNNPFRRRHASQPQSIYSLDSRSPPPLPPRKPSLAPSLPPRKACNMIRQTSSSSIDSSFRPTSSVAPSTLMYKSLVAAGEAQANTTGDSSIHVIKSSSRRDTSEGSGRRPTPRQSRRSLLMDEVASALKAADIDSRAPTFSTIAESYRARDKNLRLWSCVDILHDGPSSESPTYAMIIVNQPIRDRDIFSRAWRASRLRLCADGGANRLYDLWDTETRKLYLPDMIKGDLDSIRADVKSYYLAMGVTIIQDRDEYSTDLMKCIVEVEKEEGDKQFPLLLIGGLSGRIDQTVHTMSLFHKMRKRRPESYVLSGESLAWFLDKGSHLIDIDHDTMGQTCGLLPVGVDAANVKTSGLKWNLDWLTGFEGEVSTSNHLLPEEPVVYVQTDKPIMWCVEVRGAAN
ncbi:hypothetical protein DB88DRAFT_500152 [Papiliotrema laurentii]|uniref:Thiamin pyrophosphokinase thiamin-binding domain-containing protein n=1 Tax=Papiliotrema laurentii TaxID=5418 RepID=A0AAD9CSA9_PAPLA|nr:hypothetical protein DB88DRAFT_500152 [Papiliotrema laurentii]